MVLLGGVSAHHSVNHRACQRTSGTLRTLSGNQWNVKDSEWEPVEH